MLTLVSDICHGYLFKRWLQSLNKLFNHRHSWKTCIFKDTTKGYGVDKPKKGDNKNVRISFRYYEDSLFLTGMSEDRKAYCMYNLKNIERNNGYHMEQTELNNL